jgi:hypothetical protein
MMFGFFKRLVCLHPEFTKWHIVKRSLFTPMFGQTFDEQQQRECTTCGYIQRANIQEVKQ